MSSLVKELYSIAPSGKVRLTEKGKALLATRGIQLPLRPSACPIVVARKPLEGSLCDNVEAWGTGGLAIDKCRIEIGMDEGMNSKDFRTTAAHRNPSPASPAVSRDYGESNIVFNPHPLSLRHNAKGRWPSNTILSHVPNCPCPLCAEYGKDEDCKLCSGTGVIEGCRRVGMKRVKGTKGGGASGGWQTDYVGGKVANEETHRISHAGPNGCEEVEEWACVEGCPVRLLDDQSGERPGPGGYSDPEKPKSGMFAMPKRTITGQRPGDKGGASRFFKNVEPDGPLRFCYAAKASRCERTADGVVENKHPTVKPIALMEYLIELVTPPDGVVMDPFIGSGTTAIAAKKLRRHYFGCDISEEYVEIARRRLAAVQPRLL